MLCEWYGDGEGNRKVGKVDGWMGECSFGVHSGTKDMR